MTRGIVSGCAVIAALATFSTIGSAAADLVAGWNFNGLASPVDAQIESQYGAGTLDLSEFSTGLSWQTGSDLNAWNGDEAGEGLGFTGSGANGKSAVLSSSTAGHQGLTLSMAVRATGTGHAQSVIEAWDGTDWVFAGGFSLVPSTWSTASFDLSALSFLDDGNAMLRLRLEGASSSQGNLRLDNVRLEGTAVPAPAALSLLGSAALAFGRRRRT